MIRVDFRPLTQPVGIIRMVAVVITCATFSLASTDVSLAPTPYLVWCIFTWTFCFIFTLLALVLELLEADRRLAGWDDLTAGWAVLQGLMSLSAAIAYPALLRAAPDGRSVGAAVLSWAGVGLYAAEAAVLRLRPRGQTSGFFSTPAGVLKIMETLLGCLILVSLDQALYGPPAVGWCVAVYSLCLVAALLMAALTLTRLAASSPVSFDKLAVGLNALAAAMYVSAAVLWPLFTCGGESACEPGQRSRQVAVTVLTVINCLVYILDAGLSIFTVFFAREASS